MCENSVMHLYQQAYKLLCVVALSYCYAFFVLTCCILHVVKSISKTRMWADAQRDGRPAEYRWRPLFNAAKADVACSNAAKTRYQLKFAGVPQNTGPISATSGPKFTILWGHL